MKSDSLFVKQAWLAVSAASAIAVAAIPCASHAATAASLPSAAASSTPGQTGQRNKMKECNAEARQKNLHKAERRAFMKECLSKGGST